jgi:hypothetical protein
MPRPATLWICFAVVVVLIGLGSPAAFSAQALEPIVYTVKVSKPDSHAAEVEAVFPTSGRPAIDIMMAVWSPGFYRVEDYARRVEDLTAKASDGTVLKVEHPEKNRWRVETGGKPKVAVSYRLICRQSSVTTDYVGEALGVFNGAATFITWFRKNVSSTDELDYTGGTRLVWPAVRSRARR